MTKKSTIIAFTIVWIVILGGIIFFLSSRQKWNNFITQSTNINLKIDVWFTHNPIWSTTIKLTNVWDEPITSVKLSNTLPSELGYEWDGRLRYPWWEVKDGCVFSWSDPVNEGNNDVGIWNINGIYIAPWKSCDYRVSLIWVIDNNKPIINKANILNTYPVENDDLTNNNSIFTWDWNNLWYSSKWLIYTQEKTMDVNSCLSGWEVDVYIKYRSKWSDIINSISIDENLPENMSIIQGSLELYSGPPEQCNPEDIGYQGNKITLSWLNILSPSSLDVYGNPCVYKFKVKFDKTLASYTYKNTITTDANSIPPESANQSVNYYFRCNADITSWVIFDKQIRRCDKDGSNCIDVSTTDPNEPILLIDSNYMQYRLHLKNNSSIPIKSYKLIDSYVPWNFWGWELNWDDIDDGSTNSSASNNYDNILVPDWCDISGLWENGPYHIRCDQIIQPWGEINIIFGHQKPIQVKQWPLTIINVANLEWIPDIDLPDNGVYKVEKAKDYTLLKVWITQGEWECAWHINIMSTNNLNEYKYNCNGSDNNSYTIDLYNNSRDNIFHSTSPNWTFTLPGIWDYTFYCDIGDFQWNWDNKICAINIKWEANPDEAKYCRDHFKVFIDIDDPYNISYTCDGNQARVYNIFDGNTVYLNDLPTGVYTFQSDWTYQIYCNMPNWDWKGNTIVCVEDYILNQDGFNLSQWIPKITTSKYWNTLGGTAKIKWQKTWDKWMGY